jgi:hypothetical protein
VLFFSILGLMLLCAPELRVYYQVTVVEVSVERVTPDGQRIELPTPPRFAQPGYGYWRGDVLMSRLEPRIRDYMRSSHWAREAQPGTRFVWTVRWSENSTRLDQVDRIVWEAPDGDAPGPR